MIKPLPKTSQQSALKDYRPIALTSCIRQLLERYVKKCMIQNTPLDPLQFAYRSQRPTADAILYLTTAVTIFVDQKVGNYGRCLFFDFSCFCFVKHAEAVTTKARQRLYVVKRSKLLADNLIKTTVSKLRRIRHILLFTYHYMPKTMQATIRFIT